eukprot:gene44221-58990_t
MAGAGARGMLGVAFGITPESPEFDELREEFFVTYERRMLLNTQVFDGVQALIEALREQGLLWGVVTNKSMRFTDPLTRAIPLFETAGAVISGDTTPFAKPHPEPLHEAARRLGVPSEACMYVGDDERDIIAGRAAAMPTVAAAYGYLGATAATDHWKADATIATPSALLSLLQLPAMP